ncbi:hypothetical protein Sste5344_004544 [Sporothrix stenoceras]
MSTVSSTPSTSTNRKSRRVPAELRQRTENSCDRCKTRKHKCRRMPGAGAESDRCYHCVKYGYECTVTKPRKPRLPPAAAAAAAATAAASVLVDAYSARMEAMEELIKGLVPEADVTSLESLYRVGKELGIPISSESTHRPEGTATQDQDTSSPATTSPANNTNNTSATEQPGMDGARSLTGSRPLPNSVTRASYASPPPSSPATSSTSSNQSEALVQDRQGQQQYIGQASSYYFQIHLQTLVGGGHRADAGQMQLFGPNPVDKKDLLLRQHGATTHAISDVTESPEVIEEETVADLRPPTTGARRLSSGTYGAVQPAATSAVMAGLELLSGPQSAEVMSSVNAFFEHVNTDFPVLHEATFLETLESNMKSAQGSGTCVNRVWLCTLYCVMILGRLHVMPISTSHTESEEDPDELWLWAQIEALLPTVLFTTSLASIQALLLASLHLHNTNSRDVCWTLTGAALRLGYAIGLHRPGLVDSDTTAAAPPLLRAMRKTIWWTLYAFEQLQVSSHDRPSAVGSRHVQPLPATGTSGYGHAEHASRLILLLGRANAMPETVRTNYGGPLAPAVALLRDLTRWHAALPAHLSVDAVQYAPPGIQRATLMLHIQYHYIVCLVARHALLSRYTAMQNGGPKSTSGFGEGTKTSDSTTLTLTSPCSATVIADACQDSGREAIVLLLRLVELDQFNARTGLDVYYLYSATLVLVLSLICDTAQRKSSAAAETRILFQKCADLARQHRDNHQTPGTMRRWLSIIGDLHELALDVAAFTEGMYDGRADFTNPPAIPPLVLEFFNTSTANSTLDNTFGTGPTDWSFDYYMSTDDAQNIPSW